MKFTIKLQGTTLIMSNGRLANPLDPIAREMGQIRAKMKKTERDYRDMAHLEFTGSLYFDPAVGPFVPGDNIGSALVEAAKKKKAGKTLKGALVMTTAQCPIVYKDAAGRNGPRTIEKLWEDPFYRDERMVKTSTSARTLSTLPLFHNWITEAEGELDTDAVDWHTFVDIVEIAGALGLGAYRPRSGRFTAEAVKN